jgi:hypothetical protein
MNVKKITSLFLVLLLLIPNIGMTINVHYCGDSIASISLDSDFLSVTEPEDCCAIAESAGEDTCCKDKWVHLDKKADEATVKIVLSSLFSPFVGVPQQTQLFGFTTKTNFKKAESTPFYVDVPASPLYQLYHQYIFYA